MIRKEDKEVMELLGLTELNRVICHTNKGYLTLQLRKGGKEYHLVLDAVPLDKNLNEELMKLLFPIKKEEVNHYSTTLDTKGMVPLIKAKIGRPSGAKSGKSTTE